MECYNSVSIKNVWLVRTSGVLLYQWSCSHEGSKPRSLDQVKKGFVNTLETTILAKTF